MDPYDQADLEDEEQHHPDSERNSDTPPPSHAHSDEFESETSNPLGRKYATVSLAERYKVQTLRLTCNWTFREIQQETGLSLGTLHRCVVSPENPPKEVHDTRGRKRLLDLAARQKLIALATSNAYHRQLPYTEIAKLVGIQAERRTLSRMFEGEGFHHRVARIKPFLTQSAKDKRLTWGQRFGDWLEDDWVDVLFSDESSFNCGAVPGRTWVTRQAGEEYQEDCLMPKFSKQMSQMVWGAIRGNGTKSPLILREKAWGTITSVSYCEHVIDAVAFPYWQAQSVAGDSGYVYFMQDNAPPHKARATMTRMKELGFDDFLFPWPASSPDMNPIEEIWRRMKYRISRRNPRPTKIAALRQAIQEEWDAITKDEIMELCHTMTERVAALVVVNGGHTRY